MSAWTNAARNGIGLVLAAALVVGPARPASSASTSVDCGRPDTLCVDVVAGETQEFSNIQDAVDKARKGRTVVVFPGDYDGFRVTRRGTAKKRITVTALPGARITGPEAGSEEGIYLARTSYVTVEGFEIDARGMKRGIGSHDSSANKPSLGLEVLNNTVYGANQTNIYLSHARDALIGGNVAYDSVEAHGIYLTNAGSDDTVLRGNDCFNNYLNGIHFNGDARFGGDGAHTGLLIEANLLHDNGQNGLDMDGVRQSTLRNNVIYRNFRHGLRAFAIDAAAGPADLVIANNSFSANGGWAVKLTEDDGGHTIFNNVLLSDVGSVAVEHADFDSDNNIVRNAFSLDGEATVIKLSGWRAAGHGGASRKSTDAKVYRRPPARDYRLKAGSPAIDSGVLALRGVAAPETDIDGVVRPQGASVDAGAYELASTRTVTRSEPSSESSNTPRRAP